MVYYSGGYQFDAREKPIFDSRITKCVFRSSGDLNFVVVVEDCDIGGLGWNTYFFPNFHILNFVWETDEGKTGNIILLIFVLSGCFNCRWVRVEEEVSLGPAEIASFCSCFFSQFGWAASPSENEVSRYSVFIGNLTDELIRLLSVLLKEIRMLRESKILSFWFLALIKGMWRCGECKIFLSISRGWKLAP